MVVELDGGGGEVADAAGQGGHEAVHAAVGEEAVGVGSRGEVFAGDEERVILGKRRSVDLGADLGGEAGHGGGCESGRRVGSATGHAVMVLLGGCRFCFRFGGACRAEEKMRYVEGTGR